MRNEFDTFLGTIMRREKPAKIYTGSYTSVDAREKFSTLTRRHYLAAIGSHRNGKSYIMLWYRINPSF